MQRVSDQQSQTLRSGPGAPRCPDYKCTDSLDRGKEGKHFRVVMRWQGKVQPLDVRQVLTLGPTAAGNDQKLR